MILEKQTQSVVLQEGEQTHESIGMSLDLDSAQVLMQMLSKNLYSDAIGSTIRECASNALDSHRRVGTTDPIIVSFRANKDNNYEFSVEDFGTGLDAEDVKNIISKYGKSTKRNSNTELGMMGLGFKAPLAYASSFYFVARKDGMERKYMMYEGEEVNTIDLLYEKPTTDRNGVKVIIPVSYRDRWQFTKKINEQLAYFESVYFDVEGMYNDNIVIMRHEHFQWSSLADNSYLHICLDNVYYPLDFKKLEINDLPFPEIPFPVALRFTLSDGLFPTPNRESLRYTREAKAVIMNKLRAVADFFVNKYNETVKDTDDVYAAMDYFKNSNRYVRGFDDNLNYNVTVLQNYATIKFATPNVKGLYYETAEFYSKIREYMLGEYEIKHTIQNGKLGKARNYYHDFINTMVSNLVYVYSERIPGVKKDYLKSSTSRGMTSYIAKKEKPFKLGGVKTEGNGYTTYYNILKLYKFPKEEWRGRIKELQFVISRLTAKFINLDELDVPQEFIDARKKQSLKVVNGVAVAKDRRKKLEGEVTGKLACELERSVYGQNCKFVANVVQMKDAHQNPYLMVYGGTDKTSFLDKMYSAFPKNTTKFMVFSERELNRLKEIELHNWIHIDKFMKGEHIVFRRAATAYLIKEFMTKYRQVFSKINRMAHVSTDIFNLMSKMETYQRKYHMVGDSELYTSILEIATQNNMFDDSIYPEFRKLEKMFNRLPFLNATFGAASSWNDKDEMTDAICDLFKYYKQRIDWKHYNVRLNEDVINPVKESEIEELV
jgi:hypothetical protein